MLLLFLRVVVVVGRLEGRGRGWDGIGREMGKKKKESGAD